MVVGDFDCSCPVFEEEDCGHAGAASRQNKHAVRIPTLMLAILQF
jgi:hypothetical protein